MLLHRKYWEKGENYTSALQCKKTDFDKLYCVRNPIALLQVDHYCFSEEKNCEKNYRQLY